MVVAQHVLVRREVKLVVVLGELSVADRAVLVHDSPDFKHAAAAHHAWVAFELDYFHFGVCIRKSKTLLKWKR